MLHKELHVSAIFHTLQNVLPLNTKRKQHLYNPVLAVQVAQTLVTHWKWDQLEFKEIHSHLLALRVFSVKQNRKSITKMSRFTCNGLRPHQKTPTDNSSASVAGPSYSPTARHSCFHTVQETGQVPEVFNMYTSERTHYHSPWRHKTSKVMCPVI